MGMITMRALLRDTKNVFSRIEQDNEPFVIVRRGKAIAALVPIDPARAEAQILAAAPELIENRRNSENSRAEGRTIALEQAMLLAGETSQAQEEAYRAGQPLHAGQTGQEDPAASEPVDIPSWYADVLNEPVSGSADSQAATSPAVGASELAQLVGRDAADRVNRIAAKWVSDVTDELIKAVSPVKATARDSAVEKLTERVRRLNARLMQLKLRQELQRSALDRLTETGAEPAESVPIDAADPDAGLLRMPAALQAVRTAGDYLQVVNASLASADQEQGHRGPEYLVTELQSKVSAVDVFSPPSAGVARHS